jgi:hypothetical protein
MKKQPKKIVDYLPKEQEFAVLQAKVPTQVFEAAKEVKSKFKSTWDEILTACLQRFIDENGDRK